MSDFDEFWESADPDAGPGEGTLDPPPDGVYEVALMEAGAFMKKDGSKTFVKASLTVVSPQQRDYNWTVLGGFASQGQANITKKMCRELGVDLDTVTSLEALNDQLTAKVGTYYTVTVKTNGEYRNTYIDGKSSQSDLPAPLPQPVTVPATTTDESDIPW